MGQADGVVLQDVLERCRRASALDVVRRRAQVSAHLTELYGHQTRVGQRTEPDGDIDGVTDEIGDASLQVERDVDLRVADKERRQLFGQDIDPKPHARADLQRSARSLGQPAHIVEGFADAGEDVTASTQQRRAGFGQRNFPGRALKQPGSQRGFEASDRSADIRFWQTQSSRGRRETSQRRDFFEHLQMIEIEHRSLSHFAAQSIQSRRQTRWLKSHYLIWGGALQRRKGNQPDERNNSGRRRRGQVRRGLVVPELAARGVKVRGLVHREADVAKARDAGAREVVVGDLSDPLTVTAALKGVDRVFYIAPVALQDEVEAGRAFVVAAIEAGVRRFVFSSVIHPVLSGLPNHANKALIEEAVLNSDLEYVFLHPTVLFQNFAVAWAGIVESGVVAEPWSNDTRFSRVDYRDVAEVAAIALTEDRLLYGTFELCAEGWLDRHDVAALIGDVLGREIAPHRIDLASLPVGAQVMRPMFDHYDTIGLRGNALTLAAILGRQPRTLRAFFEELAAKGPGATK